MGIFVGYSQKRRSVRIASAGQDQMILCSIPFVELKATLTDETNTRNHTFHWKQMTGTEIILESTNQLSTSYTFVETTNKRFRFYLDYGTNKEQSMDIEVFHTPTSFMVRQIIEGVPTHIGQTIPNSILTDDFILPYDDYSYAPVTLTPAKRITFDALNTELQAASTGMEILTGGGHTQDPQNIFKSYSPLDYPTTLLLPRGVYKFLFHFTLASMDRDYLSPLVVSTPASAAASNDLYANELLMGDYVLGRITPDSFERTKHSIKNITDSPLELIRVEGFLDSISRYVHTQKSVIDSELLTSRTEGLLDSIIRYDSSNIGN